MRNIIVTTAATLLIAGQAVAADATHTTSKKELIGFGSGAVIGAVAGGPFGFVIGAAVGSVLGDSMHNSDEKIDGLTKALSVSRSELSSLETEVRTLERDKASLDKQLVRVNALARPELLELMAAGISMDLLFRTDESVLSDSTRERISTLAATLGSMDDVRIALDGYADERGDDDYNLSLSGKRVDYVREQLVKAGIPEHRITTQAHGEAATADGTLDSFALQRRVTLTLKLADPTSVVALTSGD